MPAAKGAEGVLPGTAEVPVQMQIESAGKVAGGIGALAGLDVGQIEAHVQDQGRRGPGGG